MDEESSFSQSESDSEIQESGKAILMLDKQGETDIYVPSQSESSENED